MEATSELEMLNLREARNKLHQIRVLLCGILLMGAVVALCFMFARTPCSATRWAGMLLQLAGIIAVVKGLVELLLLFGSKTVWEQIRDWTVDWKYVIKKRPPISARADQTIGDFRTRGYGQIGLRLQGTTDEKFRAIEQQINIISRNIANIHAKLDKNIDDTVDQVMKETKERIAADQKQAELQKESMVGSIQVEFVGAIFVFFGILFSSWPSCA